MRIKVRSSELVGPVQQIEVLVNPVVKKAKGKYKTLPIRYRGTKGGFTYSLL